MAAPVLDEGACFDIMVESSGRSCFVPVKDGITIVGNVL